ncbi:metal ABC transporter permease [Rubrobacter indicoceani]|uniref:metal ABC transporter permease n=1 Tax=Rubrobacter indicoceani TaxID=2051957 RepID=UPI0019694637|nr:metal ABC transporter permease [Rubrobacter indicoceani]
MSFASGLLSRLTEPLGYSFMQTGLLAALLIGATCAVLGVYVVLRGMAFIGDALSHTVLPGLAASYLLGLNLLAGAVAAGILTAFGVGWLSRNRTLREDTAIGVAYTGMFALGVVLMSSVNSFRDFSHILFGNILGVTPASLLTIALLSAGILLTVFVLHKELELTSFDPTHASAIGLDPDRLRYILLVLLALTVVIGIQAVGVILISALLITPAATASLLTDKLHHMMALAVAFSVFAATGGLYASYYLDLPSGAAIVLLCTSAFLVTLLLKTLSAEAR